MKHKSIVENVAKIIFTVCAVVAIFAVLSITIYMFLKGAPAFFKVGVLNLLFGTKWAPTAADPSYGILYIILTSIIGTAVSILIGVPIALLTAVFLTEVSNQKLSAVVQPAVELLAAIPSVIYGLLGLMILNPVLYKLEKHIFANSATHQFTGGSNLFAAIIVLAIMILPTVINMSVSSIQAVPQQMRAASLALGATKIQTIFKVTVPAAKSGIMTGIVLGIGRARRSDGYQHGSRWNGKLSTSVQLSAFPYHTARQRDGICQRTSQTGAFLSRSCAFCVYHDNQHHPYETQKERSCGK